ncbi:hypothetical protein DL770_010620 [Monosporascus sp. CRB-9-2]|nr:hypothetical protein DL770_010620 [Monosporascus sp. CRB-9-2]
MALTAAGIAGGGPSTAGLSPESICRSKSQFKQGLNFIWRALLKEDDGPTKTTNELKSPLPLSFHPSVPLDVTRALLDSKAGPMSCDDILATWEYSWEFGPPDVLNRPGDDSLLKFREVLRHSRTIGSSTPPSLLMSRRLLSLNIF